MDKCRTLKTDQMLHLVMSTLDLHCLVGPVYPILRLNTALFITRKHMHNSGYDEISGKYFSYFSTKICCGY